MSNKHSKELDARVARAMGARDVPDDPADFGEYWYFPVPFLGTKEVLRIDFEPTNPFNYFFIVVLQEIHKLQKVDIAGFTHRAKGSKDGEWRYGSLGEAVCLAFLDKEGITFNTKISDIGSRLTKTHLFIDLSRPDDAEAPPLTTSWNEESAVKKTYPCGFCAGWWTLDKFPKDSPIHRELERHPTNPNPHVIGICKRCLKEKDDRARKKSKLPMFGLFGCFSKQK